MRVREYLDKLNRTQLLSILMNCGVVIYPTQKLVSDEDYRNFAIMNCSDYIKRLLKSARKPKIIKIFKKLNRSGKFQS